MLQVMSPFWLTDLSDHKDSKKRYKNLPGWVYQDTLQDSGLGVVSAATNVT